MTDQQAQVFADAVVLALADISGIVISDLAALLIEQRQNPGDANEDESILQPVRGKLSGNAAAGALVDTIKAAAAVGAIPFGPVVAGSIAAGHRLELLMRLGNTFDSSSLVLEFVRVSDEEGISQLQVAQLARDIFENRLGGPTTLGNQWRDWVVPSILQMPRMVEQGSFDDVNFVQVATGGELPDDWKPVTDWLAGWVSQRTGSPQDFDFDGDITGFFKPDVAGFRPAALHPLVLRILREQFNVRLDSGEADELIRRFCEWLRDHVFEGSKVLDGATPQVAFAAGMLILDIATRSDRGVMIREDGSVTGSANDPFWVNLAESVLASIVRNSEQTDNNAAGWQNQQDKVLELLQTCKDWQRSPISLNLRARAANRLQDAITDIITTLPDEDVKLATEDYMPGLEAFERRRIPELRPDKPITEQVNLDKDPGDPDFWKGQRRELSQQLKAYDDSAKRSTETAAVAEQSSAIARTRRKTFAERFASPLARIAFAPLAAAQEIQSHAANAAFLRRQLAEIALQSTRINEASISVVESLDNYPSWVSVINNTLTPVRLTSASTAQKSAWSAQMRQAWADLERWDGLRGRLLHRDSSENEQAAAALLYDRLPTWLSTPNAQVVVNANDDRPKLAAVVHLGLLHDNFNKLGDRLETLLRHGGLDTASQALLAAGRIELGLTAMADGAKASEAFSQLDGFDDGKLTELLSWAGIALQSDVAWESRAGFSLLILLARFAEATGDLFLATNLAKTLSLPGEAALRASQIIEDSLDLFIVGTNTPGSSGLPLALVAFDLLRYTRAIAAGMIPEYLILNPGWLKPHLKVVDLIDRLYKRAVAAERTCLDPFAAEGGVAAKQLLLSLLDIKLAELKIKQRLLVRPLLHGDVEPLIKLRGVVRSIVCSQELLLRGIEENASRPDLAAWWKPHYWSALAASADALISAPLSDALKTVPLSDDILTDLNGERVTKRLLDAFQLHDSGEAAVRIRVAHDAASQQQGRWLLLGVDDSVNVNIESRVFLIQAERDVFGIYPLEISFQVFNWADTYNHAADTAALALAANLEAAIPAIPPESTDNYFSDQLFKDIDGRYEGEFPDIAFKAARDALQQYVKEVEEQEQKFLDAVNNQNQDIRSSEITNLLKLPLRLSTADYQEQLQAALADVREAEADLEAAEHGSLAAEFEQFAAGFMYEAARVESERQSALVDIEAINVNIVELEKNFQVIDERTATTDAEIIKKDVDKAENNFKRAELLQDKALRGHKAIKEEIELIRQLLGGRPGVEKYKVTVKLADGTLLGEANGQIAVLGLRVGHHVGQQLDEELQEAQKELEEATEKERAQKKKEKRRRLVNAACRFIGAAVGTYFGGPAGATLGAEIGSAFAEVASGVSENKPSQEILVGLIDNSFTIAGAAGYDLEKKLNSLSAKGKTELNDFIKDIDVTLEPLIRSMPKVFDKEMFKVAFEVLDLEEVPQLAMLFESTYSSLQKDFKVSNPNLGTALKNAGKNGDLIQLQDPKQLLGHLKNALSANTQGNIEQIKALAKTLGDKAEELTGDDPTARQKVAERLAGKLSKVVVAKIGQESENYRRDIVQVWTQKQRDDGKDWSKVREEGQALLGVLFSDAQTREQVLKNLEASLLPDDEIRGKIQRRLDPWQKELNVRLAKIMEMPEEKANTALEAARQRFDYITQVKKKFEDPEKGLLPWMEGKGNEERNMLLEKLDDLEKQEIETAEEIDLTGFNFNSANLSKEQAKLQLKNTEARIEQAQIMVKAANLNVDRSSLLKKVADLSKVKSENEADATKELEQAAKERALGAKANIKSAKYHLDSCRALAQAAERRGVEASGIRSTLSQPPLRLPNLSASAIAQARASHAVSLDKALKWYREVKRYLHFIGLVEIPALLPLGAIEQSTWSEKLRVWLKEVDELFLNANTQYPSGFQPISWELTPEQIRSLLSPSGFSLVVSNFVPEDLFLFAVTEKLESSALFSALESNELSGHLFDVTADAGSLASQLNNASVSPAWKTVLENHGVLLSDQARFDREAASSNSWRLTDDNKGFNFLIQQTMDNAGNPVIQVYGRSFWHEAFATNGLHLSRHVEGRKLNDGEWLIIDREPGAVTVQSYGEAGNKKHSWLIDKNGLEPIAFNIRFEKDTLKRYNVHLHHPDPAFGANRSDLADRHFAELTSAQVGNGRVCGIFLSAKSEGGGAEVAESDYSIQVEHLGDRWLDSKRLQLRQKCKLKDHRGQFISLNEMDGGDLGKKLNDFVSEAEGDPDPFVIQGTPLAGTTVIRLVASGSMVFKRIKLQVLYKFYS